MRVYRIAENELTIAKRAAKRAARRATKRAAKRQRGSKSQEEPCRAKKSQAINLLKEKEWDP